METVVHGKSTRKIVRIDEDKCDGLGACLGACPRGAITIEERPADAFDESAVAAARAPGRSQLSHWPVQLALVGPSGDMWKDADVLIAADCVAFAMPDFHQRLLAGRAVVIACPKLDDVGPYIDKLTRIFTNNPIRSVTVAHMEVPCCTGIVMAAKTALENSGRTDISLTNITVGVDGTVLPDTGVFN